MGEPKWHRVTDLKAFFAAGRTVKGTHAFTKRALHWPYCAHCGLLLLKNEVSRRAANAACIRLED